MAVGEERVIGRSDLVRAVGAVAAHFNAAQVIVVGSRALLVERRDTERSPSDGREIDTYPADARGTAPTTCISTRVVQTPEVSTTRR